MEGEEMPETHMWGDYEEHLCVFKILREVHAELIGVFGTWASSHMQCMVKSWKDPYDVLVNEE